MSNIYVDFNFKGASGKLVNLDHDLNKVVFNLKKESHIDLCHSFLFKVVLSNALPSIEFTIDNAGESRFEKGWKNYLPYISSDSDSWQQITKSFYSDGKFTFKVENPPLEFFVAWYPPYNSSKLYKVLKEIAENPNITVHHKNSELPYLTYGDSKAACVIIIGRQHPGESMSSFFLEGIMEELNKQPTSDVKNSFLIFPLLNTSGVEKGNHRFDSEERDYNRDWGDNDNPTISCIKEIISKVKHPVLFWDIHGDEVSKISYVYYHKIDKIMFSKILKPIRLSLPQFYFLKRPGFVKRLVKAILYKRKIPNFGKTAANYFNSNYKIPSFTLEISAHKMNHRQCKEAGNNFLKSFINI